MRLGEGRASFACPVVFRVDLTRSGAVWPDAERKSPLGRNRRKVSLFHVREIGVNLNGPPGNSKEAQFEYIQHGF